MRRRGTVNTKHVGAWRSPVAYSLGVRVVGRSNRLAPTNSHEPMLAE